MGFEVQRLKQVAGKGPTCCGVQVFGDKKVSGVRASGFGTLVLEVWTQELTAGF